MRGFKKINKFGRKFYSESTNTKSISLSVSCYILCVLWMGWTCSKADAAVILSLLLAYRSQLCTSTKSSVGYGETGVFVAAMAFNCALGFLAIECCVVESARLVEGIGLSERVAGHHTVFPACVLSPLACFGVFFRSAVLKEAFMKTENMSLGAALNSRKRFRMLSCIGGEWHCVHTI